MLPMGCLLAPSWHRIACKICFDASKVDPALRGQVLGKQLCRLHPAHLGRMVLQVLLDYQHCPLKAVGLNCKSFYRTCSALVSASLL